MPLYRALGVVLLWCAVALAQSCPGLTTQVTPFATETLTVSDSALALTTQTYKPIGVTPALAILTVEGGAIRYAVVGFPTATMGHLLTGAPPQTVLVCGVDVIAAFKAIRQTTLDATLTATYYKIR